MEKVNGTSDKPEIFACEVIDKDGKIDGRDKNLTGGEKNTETTEINQTDLSDIGNSSVENMTKYIEAPWVKGSEKNKLKTLIFKKIPNAKMLEIDPIEYQKYKYKLNKRDVILAPITVRNSLAYDWFETLMTVFPYANPYRAIYTPFKKLFENNVEKQYEIDTIKRSTGQILFKEDPKKSNGPRFAFMIFKNLQKMNDYDKLSMESQQVLNKAGRLDTVANLEKWFNMGLQMLKHTLLIEFPLTSRLMIPLEFLLEYPTTLWEQLLEKIKGLNAFFYGVDIVFINWVKLKVPGEITGPINMIREIKSNFPILNITVTINGRMFEALVDSGASSTVCHLKNAQDLGLDIKKSKVKLRTANNEPLRSSGQVKLPIVLGGKNLMHACAICVEDDALYNKVILGLDWLKANKVIIDCEEMSIYFKTLDFKVKGTVDDGSTLISGLKQYKIPNCSLVKLKENLMLHTDQTKVIEVVPKTKLVIGKKLFKPYYHYSKVFPESILEFEQNKAHLMALNPDNKYILNIAKGTVIGSLHDLSDYIVLPYNEQNFRVINGISLLTDELRKDKRDIQSDFEESELKDIICKETSDDSLGRIFLLENFCTKTKKYNGNTHKDSSKINIINFNDLNSMDSNDFENYLYDLDYQTLSDEDRKSLVKLIIEQHLKTHPHKNELTKILLANYKCVALSDLDIGDFRAFTCNIEYKGETIRKPNYVVALKHKEPLRQELERLLRAGVIRESDSPFNSNFILVPKKGTKRLRLVLDSRFLNEKTVIKPTILPRITDMLFTIGQNEIFSNLDLLSAYWSIHLSEGSSGLTAFSTPFGRFEYVRMAMGLAVASDIFTKAMVLVLDGLINVVPEESALGKIHYYLDDIIISSKNAEGNLRLLNQIFERFTRYNMKIKLNKCKFLQSQIEFLGHEISKDGFKPIDTNIMKVNNFPVPKTIKDVRAFLGTVNYYRGYIKNIASKARPLYELTSNLNEFRWSEEAQKAFDELKNDLTKGCRLFHPDFKKPFVLECDANHSNLAGILSQRDSNGVKYPLMFLSKKLSIREQQWTIAEKELSAITFCLNRLRNLILGYKIIVVTDHYNLTNILTTAVKNSKMLRMSIIISEFAPDLIFKCGKENIAADYMSRFLSFSSNEDDLVNIMQMQVSEQVEFNIEKLPEYYKNCLYSQNIMKKIHKDDEVVKVGRHQFFRLQAYLYRIPKNKNYLKQLLIPTQMVNKLIWLVHGDLMNGHPSTNETCNKILQNFFFPNMHKSVLKFIRNCVQCQRQKSGGLIKPQLVLYSINYIPFQTISIDLIGPLYIHDGSKTYILNAICRLTRFIETCVISDKTAKSVAQGLINIIYARHSVPKLILSDLGNEFNNELTREIATILQIKNIFTCSFSPASNGLIERSNAGIGKCLRIMSKNYDDWPKYLQLTTHALNCAINRTTGRSPFSLLYFRDPCRTYNYMAQLESLKGGISDTETIKSFFINVREIYLELAKIIDENSYGWSGENTKHLREKK